MRAERAATAIYAIGLVVLCSARLLSEDHGGRFAWFGLVVAAVGFAPLLLRRTKPERAGILMLVASSTLACIALLVQQPLFSDDIWRYAVDASLTHAGIHPFSYAPDSPKLQGIADAQRALSNHPHMRTIYPPGAQLWFATWHVPGSSGVLGLRVGAVVAAALGAWLLRRFANDRPGLPAWVALWAHPLVLVAVAGNGHIDALALPIAVAWTLAIRNRRGKLAALVAAIGVAVKLMPALLWAATVPRFGWGALRWAALGALCAGTFWIGWLGLGSKSFGSLGIYASEWTYNGSIAAMVSWAAHAVFVWVAGADGVHVVAPSWTGVELAGDGFWLSRWQVAATAARVTALAVLACVGGWMCRWHAAPDRTALALLMALFLTSPVVHPWYLLWLLPIAILASSRAALLWSLTVLLAFFTPAAALDGLPWAESLILRCIQYAPVYGALILALATAGRTAALTARGDAP